MLFRGKESLSYKNPVYLGKFPPDAIIKDNFYLQPILKVPEDLEQTWFLGTGCIVRDICKGNILGNKTNHSTGASNMFQTGVPEKIIQQWTGHHFLTGLHNYKHTTIEQQEAVCQILSSDKNETFTTMPPPQMQFSGCSVVINCPPATISGLDLD